MSQLFIGIEGGATKTEGVLIDDIGKIYVTLQTGPSNPWVIQIIYLNIWLNFLLKVLGFDNVAKLLKNLIDDILVKGDINWNQIASVVSEMNNHWITKKNFIGYIRVWC